MKEQQNNGMKHLELTDADQIIEIECHVSKKLFEVSAEDLINALCLWENTKQELFNSIEKEILTISEKRSINMTSLEVPLTHDVSGLVTKASAQESSVDFRPPVYWLSKSMVKDIYDSMTILTKAEMEEDNK